MYRSSYSLASATALSKEVGDCATTSLLISVCRPLKKQFSKASGGRPIDLLANDINLR